MRNKTCGECQWYDHHHLLCIIGGDVKPTERAKDCFVSAKPTNGDRIRQMSNEGIAAFVCGVLNDRREETFRSVLDLINAPAESEVCVSQNEKNDTQADLCVADNTESEGVIKVGARGVKQ